jgi:succinyl-CoA synthetase beta subunit
VQILECDAKSLLSRYAIASPAGIVAATADEAEAAATRLGSDAVFVKAQVRAGNREAAGGIRSVRSAADARAAAAALLGRRLATTQTRPEGFTVSTVLVEEAVPAKREFYLSAGVDIASAAIMVTVGKGCSGDVEKRLRTAPDEFARLPLRIGGECEPGDIAVFCGSLGLTAPEAAGLHDVIVSLHRAVIESDARLIEINPLVLTEAGAWVALDAKLVVDDNAAFRQADLAALGRDAEEDQVELHAQRHQINFVQMDGDVGAVVNGAGLGLATLDMIRAAGGKPANFMDIRTTAKSLDIAQGAALVLNNPRAKVLLVNVFGGGMQPCDTIVEGLGIACRRSQRKLPLVLRITGNNEDIARRLLKNFNLPGTECRDMWQAVTRAVALANGRT